jgi:hypothetical protein
MATSHQQAKSANEEAKNGSVQNADSDMWAGFERIETDRFMFNPNEGCDFPLVGYIINLIPMPPIERRNPKTREIEWQDWECFVVKTTKPTKAVDREKHTVAVPTGKEVLVPATYMLSQHFTRVATNAGEVYEVLIVPKKKVAIGNGQTMWTWDLGVNMKTPKPRAQFGASGMLGTAQTPIMLPSQGRSAASDIVAEGTDSTAESLDAILAK